VIKRCLDTDPAKRYSSAVEVANAMAEIEGNCLDWQLTAHADKNVWTKNEKGTEYEFTVHKDGHSDCYKSVDGGLRRRVAAACKPGMTDRDLRKVFTGY
jgi:hypothetical protein